MNNLKTPNTLDDLTGTSPQEGRINGKRKDHFLCVGRIRREGADTLSRPTDLGADLHTRTGLYAI